MTAAGTNSTNTLGPVLLSVVIPVYNEEDKIGRDLESLFDYLRQRPYAAEAIVVDDGSADRTAQIVRGSAGPGRNLCLLSLDRNRGKGRAVKTGIMAARGQYILVVDAGGCVPYENLERGIGLLEAGACDVALGSRSAAGAFIRRRQAFHRRLGSWIFRRILCPAMGLRGVTDTQCGFKLFGRRAARAIFSSSRINGFMFDVETVLKARRQGLRLAEFPVDWTNDPDTRLRLVSGSLRNVGDLIRLRLGI
jgi:dolichyl-phosphate beta-glucosyltransferase